MDKIACFREFVNEKFMPHRFWITRSSRVMTKRGAEGLFKTGVFIKNRIEEYKRCLNLADDAIPPCSSEERWDRPPKFAVMKTGQKRAVRLFDDQQAAEALAGEKGMGHYVEHRSGESIKCRSFCLCCRYCNYYHKNVAPWTDAPANAVATEKAAA
jgi:hypothetical protein